MSKIIRLQAENIKRLKAVQIDPEGHMIVVGGKNGQGKTSTLDAIWYALGGKGAMPSEPLRKGAEKGYAKVTLDSGLIITRRVTKKGTTLKVETAEGLVHSSPQQMLDGMVGAISFDPMAFARMDAKQQLVQLRCLLGVDTMKLDEKRSELYGTRTTYNRKIKDLRSQLAGVVYSAGGPDEEVSVSMLMVQLEEFEGAQADHQFALRQIETMETELAQDMAELERLREQVKLHQVSIKSAKARLPRMKKAADAMPLPDPDAVRDQISKADDINRNVRAKAQHKAILDRVSKGEDEVTKMNQKIDAIDEEKREMLASAEFPVAGLSFDSETVRFNDIPFDQCSSAEQTRVSVGMALAMNPELRVLLIRDGSLLDEDSFKMIAEMAAEADAQVWVEAVSTDEKKCAVIIEDGAVK